MNSDENPFWDPEKKYGPYYWSLPNYWDDYYKYELEGPFPESCQWISSRYFEKFTGRYGLKAPLEILYAGCGISLIGEFMAYMGHHVTAIDLSLFAIYFRREAKNVDELLWRCADWRLGHPYLPEYLRKAPYKDRKAYLYKEFKSLHKEGGDIRYFGKDWNDLSTPTHCYDMIMNQNGLRSANPDETRKAARSFRRILRPGGLLITSTVNALEREEEIVPELIRAGFSMEKEFLSEEEEKKIHHLDPEKKHAVYCALTG